MDDPEQLPAAHTLVDPEQGVRLTPLRPEHYALALSWYADPEVLEGSEGAGTPPFDRARIERMYQALSRLGEVYLIEVRDGDCWVAVGDATLAPSTLPIVVGVASHRGRGVGRAVLGLLIRQARALGWRELHVQGIYAYNVRSLALYEGAGFRPCGRVRDCHDRPTISYTLKLLPTSSWHDGEPEPEPPADGRELMADLRRMGFDDAELASVAGTGVRTVRRLAGGLAVRPGIQSWLAELWRSAQPWLPASQPAFVAQWFAAPNVTLGGRPPLSLCREGQFERVTHLVSAIQAGEIL